MRQAGPGGVTAAVLGPLLAADPHRPRLTWYGTGRTELSTASLANWSAKVAGLLDVELGAAPGEDVSIAARPSWQLMPIMLGAWWAGMNVVEGEVGGISAAVFADAGQPLVDDSDNEIFVVSTHPFGAPVGDILDHQRHFTEAVLQQADRYTPRSAGASGPDTAEAAMPWHGETTLTVTDLLTLTEAGAALLGSAPRLLVPVGRSCLDLAVTLLAVLAADGSLVVADLDAPDAPPNDPAAIAADERASVTAWVDVPRVPRNAAWEDLAGRALDRPAAR